MHMYTDLWVSWRSPKGLEQCNRSEIGCLMSGHLEFPYYLGF